MKHYLVKENDQLKIIQVAPELEAAFWRRYGGKVLTSSYSIQGVLKKYNALLNYLAANGHHH